MSDRLLETFVQLVSFDQTVRSLEVEHDGLVKSLAQVNDQKARLLLDIEDIKKRVNEFKKSVDSCELVMKLLDQQELDKKKKLELVSGQKEYTSLKNEIQRLNKEQELAECELIDAWGKLDETQKKFETSKKIVAAKLEALDQEALSLEGKLKSIDITLKDHEAQRSSFIAHVPVELFDDYEHMRGLVPNPVVPVSQASCSACFYPVPNSDILFLRKGKLLPCKSCYRILYYDESVQ